MAKKKKNTSKLSDKVIESIKMLRSNAIAYREIADRLGIGYGSVQKYAKDVTFLPKSMRKNPFELESPSKKPDLYDRRFKGKNYTDLEKNKVVKQCSIV
ncbi:hypothetical protein LCGC14_1716390 [marine sediment metagenome]|uniref:Uncharacterized protein n=1 Tax=marine sediment metagenome TaxID=412755 RepID=A0A0F9KDM2_9ZZZZ